MKRTQTQKNRILSRFYALCIAALLVSGLPVAAFAKECTAGQHDYYVTGQTETTITYRCKFCEAEYTEILLGIEHEWGDWVVDKQPSCLENGSAHRVCTKLPDQPHEQTKVIAALGHAYQERRTAASCTADGKITRTCVRCNDVVVQPNGGALGHIWQSSIVKQPDCENTGVQQTVCTRCGEKTEEILPATGHNYGAWITDKKATQEQEGSRHKECANNNAHRIEETIAKPAPTSKPPETTTQAPITTQPEPKPEPEPEPEKHHYTDMAIITVGNIAVTALGSSILKDYAIIRWEKRRRLMRLAAAKAARLQKFASVRYIP